MQISTSSTSRSAKLASFAKVCAMPVTKNIGERGTDVSVTECLETARRFRGMYL